jgi:hypothetical protein
MKERKQKDCIYCEGNFNPDDLMDWQKGLLHCETRGEGIELIFDVLKVERKQACEDMIQYMEEKRDMGCDHELHSDDEPCDKMIEAAKEYLKTL